MHDHASIDSSIQRATDISISALSVAAFYGKGVFTTLMIVDRQPFFWDKHWRRLTDSAARVGIDLSGHSNDATQAALIDLIRHNNVSDGGARVTFFDETAKGVWAHDATGKTSLLIVIGDIRPVPEELRLDVSPYPVNSRSPLAGVKSCNYLENLIAFDTAKQRGFNEAIRLNERGEITSACMANVFWMKNGQIYTPSLRTGCLAGTTREFVMENVDCEEVEAEADALREADSIFLTSAGVRVAAVSEFEGCRLEPIPTELQNLIPRKNTKARDT